MADLDLRVVQPGGVGRRLLHLRQQLRVGRVHRRSHRHRADRDPRQARFEATLRALRAGVGQVRTSARRAGSPGADRYATAAADQPRALRAGRAGRLRRDRARTSRTHWPAAPAAGIAGRTGPADRPRQRCRRSPATSSPACGRAGSWCWAAPAPCPRAWRSSSRHTGRSARGSRAPTATPPPWPSAAPRSRPVCRPPSWRPAPRSRTRWPRDRPPSSSAVRCSSPGRASCRRPRATELVRLAPRTIYLLGGTTCRGRERAAGDRAGDRAAGGAPGRRRSIRHGRRDLQGVLRPHRRRPTSRPARTSPTPCRRFLPPGRLGAPLLLVQRDRLPPTVAVRARPHTAAALLPVAAAPASSGTSW